MRASPGTAPRLFSARLSVAIRWLDGPTKNMAYWSNRIMCTVRPQDRPPRPLLSSKNMERGSLRCPGSGDGGKEDKPFSTMGGNEDCRTKKGCGPGMPQPLGFHGRDDWI